MKLFLSIALCITAMHIQSQNTLQPSDIYKLQTVNNCKVSPDGNWIAYVLSSVDSAKDRFVNHIWMCDWEGKSNIQLTNSDDGDDAPQWSPDGKYLSFISSRQGNDNDGSKLWLLDRRGGEGQKLIEVKGKLVDYAWQPSGEKIALVIKEPDFADTAKTKIRKPYVIDRFHFKQDIDGYLDRRATHIYLFDITSKKLDTLTHGIYDETSPSWNPDGTQLTFVSNRTTEPDQNENTQIYTINVDAGSEPKQITTWKGANTNPIWSPDGNYISYLQSTSDENFTMYGQTILTVVSKDGSNMRILSKNFDRPVRNQRWSKDSKSIAVIVSDDRRSYPALFLLADGSMQKLADGDLSYSEIENRNNNEWATVMSTPKLPAEIYALQNNNGSRRITHTQDSFINRVELANVEGFQSISKDGTKVSGILYTPANNSNKKLPLILFIHGGPVAQDEYEFDMGRQILASGGFAVAAVNYRGSNGRGVDYCRAIFADWGNKEVKDIIGAANYLIAKGIADSSKLGIAGWSYGGILTDYTIATDQRFKAASSGAGSALQLSMWGVDEYVNQYNNELGTPWDHLDKYLKLSYPFLKANKIKTPTLFMASQSDFNVPSVGAEQMYQALRTLGVPTQLIIYPSQFHEITVPSYLSDRLQRWLDWLGNI